MYDFETPFADLVTHREDTDNKIKFQNNFSYEDFVSPFQTTYETEATRSTTSPIADEYVNLLAELQDTEFTEALYEVASEMQETWRSSVSDEVAMGAQFEPFAMNRAQQYYTPMLNEANRLLDSAANHFSGSDMAAHSEATVDMFFETLEINNENLSPVQEQFLGGLLKKAKSVVQKGVALAKKGINLAKKLSPVHIILNKLKALIKPLLTKVLTSLIKKLPQSLQSHAQNLANKFLKLEQSNESNSELNNLESLELEFDNHIVQLFFATEEHEAEYSVAQYENSIENLERIEGYDGTSAHEQNIDAAREKFINELKNLRMDEDPSPAIERFLPVALMALKPVIKMGINLIGRKKIIDFLANMVSNLIKKYVPEEVSKPLATHIIDLGLGAIGFETNDMNNANVGYEAIANTIEETIEGLNEIDTEAFKNPEELTLHVLDKFEKAAANNFPPKYIRQDLRNTKNKATFVSMPRANSVKLYKKFTQVYDVSIDPKMASSVKIYRSVPLKNFIKDKYGLEIGNELKAKVHVYQLKRGGRLSDIGKSEKLPGLNASIPRAWIQLLPLTTDAANTLLNEPNLGSKFDEKSLTSRYKAKSGQRFYFLEIEGARLRFPQTDGNTIKSKTPSANQVESRSADVQAVLNFSKSEIKLNYFFSEEDAMSMVSKIGKNDVLGIAGDIKNSVKTVFNDILTNHISSKVKIIHEAMPEMYLEAEDKHDHFSLKDLGKTIGNTIGKEAIKKVVEGITSLASSKAYEVVLAFLKTRSKEFVAAQAEPQDGVTITILWKNVPGMALLKSLLSAIKGGGGIPNLSDITLPKIGEPELIIKGGKKFD
jgi:hypothetical protein